MRTHLPLALFLPCALLPADQITLKNGDRLTGSVVKFDGKALTFKSEYAGPVTLPWDAVTTVSSTSPLHIGLQDGQTVVGVVSTDAGNYRISFDTSAVTNFRKWIAWQFTISDRFLSNPVPGRKKNDLLITTGLRFTFAK